MPCNILRWLAQIHNARFDTRIRQSLHQSGLETCFHVLKPVSQRSSNVHSAIWIATSMWNVVHDRWDLTNKKNTLYSLILLIRLSILKKISAAILLESHKRRERRLTFDTNIVTFNLVLELCNHSTEFVTTAFPIPVAIGPGFIAVVSL